MKQDQKIKKQKKVLNKKDDEIKCLALVEERNHTLKTELDELTSKHMDKSSKPGSSGWCNPEVPVLKSQRHFRPNKGFKRAQEKYLERKEVKDNKNNP